MKLSSTLLTIYSVQFQNECYQQAKVYALLLFVKVSVTHSKEIAVGEFDRRAAFFVHRNIDYAYTDMRITLVFAQPRGQSRILRVLVDLEHTATPGSEIIWVEFLDRFPVQHMSRIHPDSIPLGIPGPRTTEKRRPRFCSWQIPDDCFSDIILSYSTINALAMPPKHWIDRRRIAPTSTKILCRAFMRVRDRASLSGTNVDICYLSINPQSIILL